VERRGEIERKLVERVWEKMGLPEDIRQKVREIHSRWMAGYGALLLRAVDPTSPDSPTPEKIEEAFRRDMVEVLGVARFAEFTTVKSEMWSEFKSERQRSREAERVRNGAATPPHLGRGLDAGI
jgi:hypothetical protein